MRTLTVVAAATASLLLAPSAQATDTYTVELRQQLPRTATTQDGGAPQEDGCPGIPEDMDGWHFVLPGNSSTFVKLTVTFQPGGEQVVTSFGPPSAKHAYVASEPGALLTSAVAEVKGGSLELFNLSHTCPAGTAPDQPGDDKPADEPSATPSASPAPSSTDAGTPSPGPSSSSSEGAAPSSSPSAQGGSSAGDLAETGSGAPVGLLSGAAAALLAAGGYLVFRRRKSA
ncbi:LPXTG cell wall anchor domain-containing protein [Streptomyces sp. DG2A-72]|uniref:LPXTG cell wall anchor domain-containing protein n=1 Tax=Streptomyces sp. DG2A-72 TaxID=3051386 RepID=UPI00265B73D7|nr:LPXTG cell wall anchor domain-containing protein [Streptomyces sp. DG2A-72]MDO0933795.1 LPXTG cell wall anchor domain-containing protein [Streptomyces sp. DG2A-72]